MKILIVEDEKVAARGLENMLQNMCNIRIESIKIQNNFTAAECFLQDNMLDLLFLDLNLNGEDGFDLLKMAVAGSFHTIIVSANQDRAIEAFQYGVFDFIPKPVKLQQLQQTLNRFLNSGDKNSNVTTCISVKENEKIRLIPIVDIHYFQSRDNYVMIHLNDDTTSRHRKTLDTIEKILPDDFIRIHRSYIVQLKKIKEIQVLGGSQYNVILCDDEVLPLSRSRYKLLKTLLVY